MKANSSACTWDHSPGRTEVWHSDVSQSRRRQFLEETSDVLMITLLRAIITQAALADYERAIVLDPDSATAYHQRGTVRYIHEQYSRAIADFDRLSNAARLRPTIPTQPPWTVTCVQARKRGLSSAISRE